MTFQITINKEEHYVGIIVEGCVICVEPLVEMGCEEFRISPSVHSSNHVNASLDLIRNSTKSRKRSLVNVQLHTFEYFYDNLWLEYGRLVMGSQPACLLYRSIVFSSPPSCPPIA